MTELPPATRHQAGAVSGAGRTEYQSSALSLQSAVFADCGLLIVFPLHLAPCTMTINKFAHFLNFDYICS
jgi:hypothetical protein